MTTPRSDPLTPAQTARISVQSPTCPLCHTLHLTGALDSPRTNTAWTCTKCGQTWTPERLETVASYERYVAAH